MVGKDLSHYRILNELGRGGMGVVYEAEDTKLHRRVALKVLPAAALSSEDDRARFYREARAAASLSHPNIATVYEIDEAVPKGSKDDDRRPFIAMEFIDGETLESYIKKGPLKLAEAVRIASEAADGLKSAHSNDIVHRDIKAANVMLDGDRRAKVLDFGLAQTAQSTKLTQMGSTLGTVAYMSPEQARGEEVDLRTDIWSLGVTLYEMIAGRLPSGGDYEQAVIFSILNEEPEPLTALRTGVPMGLEWIVSKCLAKDRNDRYQNCNDLLVDLRNVDLSTPGMSRLSGVVPSVGPTQTATVGERPFSRAALLAAGAALVMLTFAATWFFIGRTSGTTPEAVAASIELIDDDGNPLNPVSLNGSSVAISPDGSTVLLRARRSGWGLRLYARQTDSFSARMIEGTTNVRNMAFSPDGEWIAYCDDLFLYKVMLDGSLPIPLAQIGGVRACRGVTWLSNEEIVYVPETGTGLFQVASSGDGEPRQITFPDRANGERDHRYPNALPDQKGVVFTIKHDGLPSMDDAAVALYDADSGNVSELFRGGSNAKVLSNGTILYSRNQSLMAARYDARRGEVVGRHQTVVAGVHHARNSGNSDYDISSNGTLVFNRRSEDIPNALVFRNESGTLNEFDDAQFMMLAPSFSPDGKTGAVTLSGPNDIIQLVRMDRSEFSTFTDIGNNGSPKWTPDGQSVAFVSDRDGTMSIYSQSVLTDSLKLLYKGENVEAIGGWTPDGETLAFSVANSESKQDIWTVRPALAESAAPLLNSDMQEFGPSFSRDGTLLAYMSRADGAGLEVYVVRYPEMTDQIRVASGVGGGQPKWDESNNLYYRVQANLAKVHITSRRNGDLIASEPKELFPADLGLGFDVTRDGDSFLTLERPPQQERQANPIRLFTGWADWLNKEL